MKNVRINMYSLVFDSYVFSNIVLFLFLTLEECFTFAV